MTTKPRGKRGKQTIRHGAYSYMTKLTLPDNRTYLRPYLSGVREGLIHDLGPTEEDLTTAQKLLIDRVVGQTGVIRLIEEHCREQGIFRGVLLQPVLAKNYGAFTNSLRLNLLALGLDKRKAEEALDVQSYIRAFDARKAKDAETGGRQQAETPKALVPGKGKKVAPMRSIEKILALEVGGQAQDEGTAVGPSREGDLEGGSDE